MSKFETEMYLRRLNRMINELKISSEIFKGSQYLDNVIIGLETAKSMFEMCLSREENE